MLGQSSPDFEGGYAVDLGRAEICQILDLGVDPCDLFGRQKSILSRAHDFGHGFVREGLTLAGNPDVAVQDTNFPKG